MRVLMVSAFPPLRDGIGKYAAAEAQELRRKGHEVEVLSPVPCAAHYVEDMLGGLKFLTLRRYAPRYDRVVLQYHPSRFHVGRFGLSRTLSDLAMWLVFATTPNLTVVCHEVDYPPEPFSRTRPEILFERRAWASASEVAFHTARELTMMEERFGVRPNKNVTFREQVAHQPMVHEDRAEARRRLGVPPEAFLFLCVGFIQPHKGFDRAIRAFREVPGDGARLLVVGSLRTETPEHRAHLEELERLAQGDARVKVRHAALSDAEFDRWIVAADRVVLPYREIWSSAVLQRVKLLGTPAIVTDVGGLREQATGRDVVVRDDDELRAAMAVAFGGGAAPGPAVSAAGAQAFVEKEAARRRGREAMRERDLAETVRRISEMRLFVPYVAPSTRPVVGPLLTFAKRAIRRALRPLLEPLVEQENAFYAEVAAILRELIRRRGP